MPLLKTKYLLMAIPWISIFCACEKESTMPIGTYQMETTVVADIRDNRTSGKLSNYWLFIIKHQVKAGTMVESQSLLLLKQCVPNEIVTQPINIEYSIMEQNNKNFSHSYTYYTVSARSDSNFYQTSSTTQTAKFNTIEAVKPKKNNYYYGEFK